MKLQRIVLLFAFAANLVLVARTQEARVYCGRDLAMSLAMFCDNGMLVKRAEAFGSLMPHDWPWLALKHSGTLERGKRQVIAECCEKPCTVDELLSYCAE